LKSSCRAYGAQQNPKRQRRPPKRRPLRKQFNSKFRTEEFNGKLKNRAIQQQIQNRAIQQQIQNRRPRGARENRAQRSPLRKLNSKFKTKN